mmetsp:Transcript_27869/g.64744  ORF Transcript_27869/g.64744 Transcript_27869/m.64744 type:complete len:779 (-) Transcript_27869:91-2427(-)
MQAWNMMALQGPFRAGAFPCSLSHRACGGLGRLQQAPLDSMAASKRIQAAPPYSLLQIVLPVCMGLSRRGISTVHQHVRAHRMPALIAFTENQAVSLATSGHGCLDFWFRVNPSMAQSEVLSLLRIAWDEDPVSTIKLVMQLGDPRRGKSNRDNHQICLLWLWRHFPATVLENIESGAFEHHTCLKGLLDLLMYAAWDDEDFITKDLQAHPDRGTVGKHRVEIKTALFLKKKEQGQNERRARQAASRASRIEDFCRKMAADGFGPESSFRVERKFNDDTVPSRMPWIEREEWVSAEVKTKFAEYCSAVDQKRNAKLHVEAKMRVERQKQKVQELRATDGNFALLYNAVADFFARELNELLGALSKHAAGQDLSRHERLALTGSLVPKWAPTAGHMHDKKTDIVTGIVERLFPQEAHMLAGGTYSEYISYMKDRYRKEVLTPLRRTTCVPEAFVGCGNWADIDYNRMPARCRLLYGESVFGTHDSERYREHIEKALQGEASVKGGAVMPHEIVDRIQSCSDSEVQQLEAQWKDLVNDVRVSGQLDRSLAVCDVSGSMVGTPMDVAVALSLLLSEVADEPWTNKVCTFSANPHFVRLPTGAGLRSRVEAALQLDWGMNTDLLKVFARLLETATKHNVAGKDMPQTLYIFSDMQFDAAALGSGPAWDTTHQQIQHQFRSAGYGEHIPKIVYWNLRDSKMARGRVPVAAAQENVVMLSGFSQGMLKSFMANELSDSPTPAAQMQAILADPYYDRCVVAMQDMFKKAPTTQFADILCERCCQD